MDHLSEAEGFSLDQKIFSTCECDESCKCEKISYNDLKRYLMCFMDAYEELFPEEESHKQDGMEGNREQE